MVVLTQCALAAVLEAGYGLEHVKYLFCLCIPSKIGTLHRENYHLMLNHKFSSGANEGKLSSRQLEAIRKTLKTIGNDDNREARWSIRNTLALACCLSIAIWLIIVFLILVLIE